MKKTYVLDTSVLIHDPLVLEKFDDNDLVIPIAVIEELDGLKRDQGEVPHSARKALKLIDSYLAGVGAGRRAALPGGGSLRIELLEKIHNGLSADDRVIETAVMSTGNGSPRTVLVSKDTAVRIKSISRGVEAEDYKHDKTSLFQDYGKIIYDTEEASGNGSLKYALSGKRLYRVSVNGEHAEVPRKREVAGINPKNIEQECALDALLAPEIEVVALTGKAGTGKTLLALAAALHLYEKGLYEQIMVSRPVVPMGNDLGFLPGEVEDKLRPWMQPIFDNLELIVNTPKEVKDNRANRYKNYNYLIETGVVQIEPLTYIRGRSLPRRFLIIDEAQNLRPLDVKTILTRAGENTKVVLAGDLDQVDTPYLDSQSNGLAYLISRFINEESFFYLNLTKGVRSALAEKAARLL